MARRSSKPRFANLEALISALSEGAMTRQEVDDALAAVRMGIGLSKRDRALGEALERTGEVKDDPVWWLGYQRGLVEGYEGARAEIDEGRELRPIADIAAEAQAEAQTVAAGGRVS